MKAGTGRRDLDQNDSHVDNDVPQHRAFLPL